MAELARVRWLRRALWVAAFVAFLVVAGLLLDLVEWAAVNR